MALMTLPNPWEVPEAMAVMRNYAREGYQLKNSTGLDASSSSGRGAGQNCDRQEQKRPPVGESGGRSVPEQEPGLEQEAQHNVQQE